jgi:hypothetical protein
MASGALGFKDDNITNRMHIIIRRIDSPRWFTYWVTGFEANVGNRSASA